MLDYFMRKFTEKTGLDYMFALGSGKKIVLFNNIFNRNEFELFQTWRNYRTSGGMFELL